MYIAAFSVMVVLVCAAIAAAQDTPQAIPSQGKSDPNSTGTNQAQDPPPTQPQATPSGQAPSDQNTPTVRITPTGFDPAQIEVPSGTPVTFVNGDTVPRTLHLDGFFDTPAIPAGSSYPLSLDGAGTVTYHDKAKPEMQGTIVLGQASQGEATTPVESAGNPPPAATPEGSADNPLPTGSPTTG